MSKSTFDPTLFNFDPIFETSDDDYKNWETNPQPDYATIGTYNLRYDVEDDWWYLTETVYHNKTPKSQPLKENKEIRLYSGRIPNDDWGFQLLKNMEILLPVVQRELKIDGLTN